jgi:CheY-like chemotaxis protein
MGVVLIVEDEVPLLILAESVLQSAGYETVSASTVAEAIAVVEDAEQKIDLHRPVPRDLPRPTRDGPRFAEAISPQWRCGDSQDVPSRSGRSRRS